MKLFRSWGLGLLMPSILLAVQGCSVQDFVKFLMVLLALYLPGLSSGEKPDESGVTTATVSVKVDQSGKTVILDSGVSIRFGSGFFSQETVVEIGTSITPGIDTPSLASPVSLSSFLSFDTQGLDNSNLDSIIEIKLPLFSQNGTTISQAQGIPVPASNSDNDYNIIRNAVETRSGLTEGFVRFTAEVNRAVTTISKATVKEITDFYQDTKAKIHSGVLYIKECFGFESHFYRVDSSSSFSEIWLPELTFLGDRVPVILIHGWNIGLDVCIYKADVQLFLGRYWGNFLTHAISALPNIQLYTFRYDTDRSVRANAADLESKVIGAFGSDKEIILLGHSMGGLVARSYALESFESLPRDNLSRVLGLITLGTPHKGSPLASRSYQLTALCTSIALFATQTDGAEDLDSVLPNNAWLSELNNGITYKNIMKNYAGDIPAMSLAHRKYLPSWWCLSKIGFPVNDGVVPRSSALLSNTANPAIPQPIRDHNHSHMVEGTSLADTDFFNAIISDILSFLPTPPSDTTPPAIVNNFGAGDLEDRKSTLVWTNPSDADLSEVVVRRKTGGLPSDHTDGDLVYQDTSPATGGTVSTTNFGLLNGSTYYYAVFSRDASGNWNDTVVAGKNADTGTPEAPVISTGTAWGQFQHDARHTGRSEYSGPQFSGEVAWSTNVGTPAAQYPRSYQPIIDAQGNIYITLGYDTGVAPPPGKLLAYKPNGSLKWESSDLNGVPYVPAIGLTDTIYVGTGNGTLYALDINNGSERWQFQCNESKPIFAITVEINGILYFSCGTRIYALTSNGVEQWQYQDSSRSFLPPVVAADGTIYGVYSGFYGLTNAERGWLYALTPSGTLKWKSRLDYQMSTLAIGSDGTIYVPRNRGQPGSPLYVVTSSGTVDQHFAEVHLQGIYLHSVLIDVNGVIVVTGWDWWQDKPTVVALSPDGNLLWKFQTTVGQFIGSIVDKNGTVFIDSLVDGTNLNHLSRIYAVSQGVEQWSIDVPAFPITKPFGLPSLGANGALYSSFIVWQGGLYQLKLYAFTEVLQLSQVQAVGF